MSKNIAVPVPAPSVTSTNKVTLADHLDLANLPLATTPGGRNFALKALHPAEPTIKAARAPGTVIPTVAVACDMVDTLPFPAGATGACIQQWPHLTHPMSVTFMDANHNTVAFYVWENAALGGGAHPVLSPTTWPSISEWSRNIDDVIQGYRITSQSITTDVIAPSVANQGTIVSAQFEMRPATRQPSMWDFANSTYTWQYACDVWQYQEPPDVSQMLMGTSAYTSPASVGFYQPLKLSRFKFVNVNDSMMCIGDNVSNRCADNATMRSPFYPVNLGNLSCKADDPPLVKPSSYGVGLTYIEGTAGNPQVALRVRFRQVAEIIPRLGGTYAPLAESPLPPDDLAYRMVQEIGARMKDAYPASYNDFGTLISTIQKIGKSVLKYADPVLDIVSMIPGVGNIASAAKLAAGLGKGIYTLANAKSTKAQRAEASQLIANNSSALVNAATTAAKQRRKQKKARAKSLPPAAAPVLRRK